MINRNISSSVIHCRESVVHHYVLFGWYFSKETRIDSRLKRGSLGYNLKSKPIFSTLSCYPPPPQDLNSKRNQQIFNLLKLCIRSNTPLLTDRRNDQSYLAAMSSNNICLWFTQQEDDTNVSVLNLRLTELKVPAIRQSIRRRTEQNRIITVGTASEKRLFHLIERLNHIGCDICESCQNGSQCQSRNAGHSLFPRNVVEQHPTLRSIKGKARQYKAARNLSTTSARNNLSDLAHQIIPQQDFGTNKVRDTASCRLSAAPNAILDVRLPVRAQGGWPPATEQKGNVTNTLFGEDIQRPIWISWSGWLWRWIQTGRLMWHRLPHHRGAWSNEYIGSSVT